ncbi:MAG: ribose-phosphate diphosphokinase [Rickettsiales bacterium]|jgi:ribose-phosphate pyrophosphokinase|nr:ribose-phosphate diphosphokinase [Rickettsiales bacterium]
MKLFSGTSNIPLTEKIAANVSQPVGAVVIKKFADGENYVELLHSARGEDVALIQSFSKPSDDAVMETLLDLIKSLARSVDKAVVKKLMTLIQSLPKPVNDTVMETLLMLDALKRNGAKRITLVAPYLGYSRQDRRAGDSRSPISAKLLADMLQVAGVNQIITADVHNLAIEGFYNIPFMNASTAELFANDICARNHIENAVIVIPDAGGSARARSVAKRLDADVVLIDKRREHANKIESMRLVGDVRHRDAILVDDIIDTGGTLMNGAALLLDKGAQSVRVYASHGLFSGDALEKIDSSAISEVVVTDSINNPNLENAPKIRQVSMAQLLTNTIRRSVER